MPTFPDMIQAGLRAANVFGAPMIQPSIVSDDPFRGGITGTLPPPQMDPLERFRQVIDAMPQREEPSTLRRILAAAGSMGAGLAGADNPAAFADQILNSKYNRQMQDWSTKFGAESKLADAEMGFGRQARMQQDAETRAADLQRKIELDKSNTEIKVADLERKAKAAEEQAALAQKRIDLATANAADLKEHRDLERSARDARFEADHALAEARLAELRNQHELENIRREKEFEREMKDREARTAAVTNKQEADTPNETKTRQYNKAREAYNTKPEWRKWIDLGDPGTNDFKINMPNLSWKIGTQPEEQAMYNDMVKFIYGNDQVPQPTGGLANTTAMVDVINPAGKHVRIKSTDLERALASGYKRIQ